MITEQGVIEEVLDNKAMVRIRESSSCAHCESRNACQLISDGKAILIEVVNNLQAGIGDHVEISMPEGSLMKISFFVYFLPVVALIVGAYAGGAWAGSFHLQPTLAAILGGGLAMGGAYCVLKWLDRGAQARDEYRPCVTRILFSETPPPQRGDSK